MKYLLGLIVALLMTIILFTGCSNSVAQGPKNSILGVSAQGGVMCSYLYYVIDNTDDVTWIHMIDSCGKYNVHDTIIVQPK